MNIKGVMSKKVVAIGLAAGIPLGLGATAFAYFSAAGSAAVASAGDTGTWGIVQTSQPASDAMYPGRAPSIVTYTITNLGSGYQALESGDLIASIYSEPNTGDVESRGSDAAKCLATWFTPVVGTPSIAYGTSIAPNASESVDVTVTMSDSAGVNHDACEGVSPMVSLAASA